jgi:ABC-2 type transport system permease protein
MRGVIEEKTSRIIEVVISSVKPIQLMLGKIIGIGLVGLTQFLLWIVLSAVLTLGGGSALMSKMGKAKMEQVAAGTQMKTTTAAQAGAAAPAPGDLLSQAGIATGDLHIVYTLAVFLFYFLFGYFLYSAIFAAVGSAVDNETETQQFMLPITLPLIFTFVLSINFIIANPHSTLSVWLSIIPFTAPIAMMIRLPFDVPPAQLALSMGMMIVGFLFVTWVAARIYRVGILMYGKKASYKELAKWFFYKE